MNPAAIYAKTAAGRAEIETRSHRLAPRVRRVLILVDGRRTLAELEPMLQAMGDWHEIVGALAADGFIEVRNPGPARTAGPVHAAGAPGDLDAAKRVLGDMIFADLGPEGGSLIMRLGECHSARQVLTHMSYVRNHYQISVNEARAEELWAAAVDLVSGP